MIYDIAIIGAGVTGAMAARRLARYDIKIALLDKNNDVAMGASKANSGIIHAGFDAKPGTLKTELNLLGCAMMREECEKLNVPYKNNGSVVIAFTQEEADHLQELYDRGVKNGGEKMQILDQEALHKLEPHVSQQAIAALWAPTAGIVCPYELTIASTECAVENGVDFYRNTKVNEIITKDDCLMLKTSTGFIYAKYIINAAGVYSDVIAQMCGDEHINIHPRRGEYFVLDKSVGKAVTATVFRCPSAMGKGVLVTPTVDGNLLIGPTSEDIDDKSYEGTSWFGLNKVRELASSSVPGVSTRDAITSFTGLRAHPTTEDFIIGISESNPRLINAAGIESPGLTSAPAIAVYLDRIVCSVMPDLKPRENYRDTREAPVRFRNLNAEERKALIAKNPAYGRIICRCETVTEGEILDAIHAPAGARDVDGVKRRVRAGMGRCQGGFCGSKVVEILARECGTEMNKITKFGKGSRILYNKTK